MAKEFEKAMTKRLHWYEELLDKVPKGEAAYVMTCNICPLIPRLKLRLCDMCPLGVPSLHNMNLCGCGKTRRAFLQTCRSCPDTGIIMSIDIDATKAHYNALIQLIESRGYEWK